MICSSARLIDVSLYHASPARVREDYERHNAQAAHEPVEMVDEGIEWTDHDGTDWHVFRCPTCGSVTIATGP